jgi:hypothetical protein
MLVLFDIFVDALLVDNVRMDASPFGEGDFVLTLLDSSKGPDPRWPRGLIQVVVVATQVLVDMALGTKGILEVAAVVTGMVLFAPG